MYIQITQIAAALSYLHGLPSPIVHGNLHPVSSSLAASHTFLNRLLKLNILVNDDGEATVAGLGQSRILNTPGFTTKTLLGAWRWMACELLATEEEDVQVTLATDVWAFAMTVIEVCSYLFRWSWKAR